MSQNSSTEPRSSIFVPDLLPQSERGSGDVKWFPRGKTSWTPDLERSLTKFFSSLEYPFRSITQIPFEEPLRSEIRRFFLSLDAYKDSPDPLIPIRDLLLGAAKKDYAVTLKRIKKKSILLSMETQMFEVPSWYNDVPGYKFTDIGQIFNYNYLIHFEGDDEKDFLNGEIPVCFNDDILEEFRLEVRSLLPDAEIEKPDVTTILGKISGSSSVDNDGKRFPAYLLREKGQGREFPTIRSPVYRSFISVSPGNERDAVISTPSDINTISYIEQCVSRILAHMRGHIHLKDCFRVSRRLNRFAKNGPYFLQRDLKKEGITKPRALLKIMLEEIDSKFPDLGLGKFTNFYESYTVIDGEAFYYMARGHGLGMANSLTTLMNLAVHNLVSFECQNSDPTFKGDCLALNDDFTAAFTLEEHLDLYWEEEDKIMKGLSLLRSNEKSFMSKNHFVIAERFFFNAVEVKKASYQLRTQLISLAAPNISAAKKHFSLSQMEGDLALSRFYLHEIVSYWGYEFFPEEVNYPLHFGGWSCSNMSGVNLTLIEMEGLPYDSRVLKAYLACKTVVTTKRKGRLYRPPILSLLGQPSFPEKYNRHVLKIPIDELNELLGRSMRYSRRVYEKYYSRLYKQRQKTYRECRPNMSFEDVVIDLIQSHPTTQFAPTESMCVDFERCNFSTIPIRDFYLSEDPFLSMLAVYNEYDDAIIAEEFSINFVKKDSFSLSSKGCVAPDRGVQIREHLIEQFYLDVEEAYLIPESYDPNEDYINPIGIGKAFSTLYFGRGYPILKPQFRHPLIEEKRSVFGRFLTFEEIQFATRHSMSRSEVRSYIRASIKGSGFYLGDDDESYPHLSILESALFSVRNSRKGAIFSDLNALGEPAPGDLYDDEDVPELLEDIVSAKSRTSSPLDENGDEKEVITMSMSLESSSYFNNWRTNTNMYVFRDKKIEDAYAEISGLMSVNFCSFTTYEYRKEVFKTIQEGRVSPIVMSLLKAWDFYNVLDPDYEEVCSSASEEYIDIFASE